MINSFSHAMLLNEKASSMEMYESRKVHCLILFPQQPPPLQSPFYLQNDIKVCCNQTFLENNIFKEMLSNDKAISSVETF